MEERIVSGTDDVECEDRGPDWTYCSRHSESGVPGQMRLCACPCPDIKVPPASLDRPARSWAGYELHYQPVVDLISGAPMAFEALSRRRLDNGDLELPGTFIPELERSRSMNLFDRWVLATALSEFSLLHDAGYHDRFRMHVNISAEHLLDPDSVLADLDAAIESSGCSANRIVIELNEEGPLDHPAVAALTRSIHLRGVQIALDDFGTHRSGLSVLDAVEFDEIKLDRRFAKRLFDNTVDVRVVRAVSRLADDIGVRVVCEGIEDEPARLALIDAGIRLGQGFLFGAATRPTPLGV